MNPIRVLLLGGEPVVRRGLRMALEIEPDVTVVGEAGDVATTLALAGSLRPDVVLAELSSPGGGCCLNVSDLLAAAPCCALVILSLFDSVEQRLEARLGGVAAFVGKHESLDALLSAIRQAAVQTGNVAEPG